MFLHIDYVNFTAGLVPERHVSDYEEHYNENDIKMDPSTTIVVSVLDATTTCFIRDNIVITIDGCNVFIVDTFTKGWNNKRCHQGISSLVPKWIVD